MKTWDETFLDLAKVYASRSKDKSSQIGAVIVGPHKEVRTGGFNGIARGLNDDVISRHERPAKYLWFCHAEENSILNAARIGTPLNGCIIYISGLPPCARCSRAIIQAGLIEVVCQTFNFPERWKEEMLVSKEMLTEAGIKIRCLDGSIW